MSDEEVKEEAAKPEENPVVLEAIKTAERLEKANQEMAENIKKLEGLQATSILGGRSMGVQEEQKEETPAEYAKRVMKGG